MDITKFKEEKRVFRSHTEHKYQGNKTSFRIEVKDHYSKGGSPRREIEFYLNDKKFEFDMRTFEFATSFFQEVYKELTNKNFPTDKYEEAPIIVRDDVT